MRARPYFVAILLLAAVGCESKPLIENPSFLITKDQAEAAMKEMKQNPVPLERPVIVVSGFRDPALGPWWFNVMEGDAIEDAKTLRVGYFGAPDMEAARLELIDEVNEAFPSNDPDWTTPVDVIGISMGGVVARYAALAPRSGSEGQRLNIRRLFTLASPHRGAIMSPPLLDGDALLQQAQIHSAFVEWLNASDRGRRYEIFPYVRLGDTVVGTQNAAPEGMDPWWLDNPSGEHAHIGGTLDVRFMADIARRLRGETPFTQPPATPLPDLDEPEE